MLYKLRLSSLQRHEALGLKERGWDGVTEGKRERETKRGDMLNEKDQGILAIKRVEDSGLAREIQYV